MNISKSNTNLKDLQFLDTNVLKVVRQYLK